MAGDGFGTCHAGQMMGCGLPSEELEVSWDLLLQHLPLCCSLPTYLLIPGQSLLGQVEFGVCGGSVGPLASGKPAVQVLPIVLPRKQEGEVRDGGSGPAWSCLQEVSLDLNTSFWRSRVAKPRELTRLTASETGAAGGRKILARCCVVQFQNVPAKPASLPLLRRQSSPKQGVFASSKRSGQSDRLLEAEYLGLHLQKGRTLTGRGSGMSLCSLSSFKGD